MSTVHEGRAVAPDRQSNGLEQTYLLAVVVPPLLLLAVFAYGKIRESYAAASNARKLAEIQSDGDPVDNHTLTQWFDRRTSKENSAPWRDVFLATRGLGNRFGILATDWVVDFERLVEPGQSWEAAPIADRYAAEAKPILDSIEKLIASPEPVWKPVLFAGQSYTAHGTSGISRSREDACQ